MDDDLKKQLDEVFGGNMNVVPGGTGAVLTRPSYLDMEAVTQAVRVMPLDELYRGFGAVAGKVVADQLEEMNLRPADYANLSDLSRMVAKRVVSYLLRSEEFARALKESLARRG
jgi:hypothetical protein